MTSYPLYGMRTISTYRSFAYNSPQFLVVERWRDMMTYQLQFIFYAYWLRSSIIIQNQLGNHPAICLDILEIWQFGNDDVIICCHGNKRSACIRIYHTLSPWKFHFDAMYSFGDIVTHPPPVPPPHPSPPAPTHPRSRPKKACYR